LRDQFIARQDPQTIYDGLTNEHAIEWVAMEIRDLNRDEPFTIHKKVQVSSNNLTAGLQRHLTGHPATA